MVGVSVIVGVNIAVEIGNAWLIPLTQPSSKTRSTVVNPCTGSAMGINVAK